MQTFLSFPALHIFLFVLAKVYTEEGFSIWVLLALTTDIISGGVLAFTN